MDFEKKFEMKKIYISESFFEQIFSKKCMKKKDVDAF